MDEPINDNSYYLVIIIMILLIVIFGGYKKNIKYQIEYDQKNFRYLNALTFFEKQLQKYNNNNFDFMKITNEVDLTHCLIPNIVDIFFVNIKPQSFFDIKKHIKNIDENIMVIYNHNLVYEIKDNFNNVHFNNDNLMLLVDSNDECLNNICNKYGYFYQINKKISILNIYPIFNDSNDLINLTIFIIKKSFWFN